MFRALLIHTADSQRLAFTEEFEPYRDVFDCTHAVEASWLARAREVGVGTPELRKDIARYVAEHINAVDMIMCTCSTLGPIFDELGDDRVARADRALMQRAAEESGDITLAYCLDSTADPSATLLRESMAAASNIGAIIESQCENAWPFFEANDQSAYAGAISEAVLATVSRHENVRCIVLAQGSMAVAATRLRLRLDMPVLCAPPIAMAWLAERAGSRSG